MALITCPECGGKLSDKAEVCVHCGYPISKYLNNTNIIDSPETKDEMKDESQKETNEIKVESYKVELVDYKDKKTKAQRILKKCCNIDVYKAFDILKQLPHIVYEGNSEKIAKKIAQQFLNNDIEYKTYKNDNIIDFGLSKDYFGDLTESSDVLSYGSYNSPMGYKNKEFKCPGCGKYISESSTKCPYCGFSDIASYLLHKDCPPKAHVATCPTCGSTNIKKIKSLQKVTNIALFGYYGNKRKKQFHCNNCGYEW